MQIDSERSARDVLFRRIFTGILEVDAIRQRSLAVQSHWVLDILS